MSTIKNILSHFDPITLPEMDSVSLLSRVDTKFVFGTQTLKKIIKDLKNFYFVLDVNGTRVNAYKSLYFDTEDFKFYYDHHNGKTNRIKVRIREYVDSGICYLEIKQKSNKGVTNKERVLINEFKETLSQKNKDFLYKILDRQYDFHKKHINKFNRITLVNKNIKERLTIDLNFNFEGNNKKGTIDNMIIAEVKQEKVNYSSAFMRLIKENGVRPFRISKYCMATASLYPNLKQNNFKPKFLHINQL
ncbi:MAG: polyphosphate polymerase domain-containing protein [Flavobacteriales bacterium]